MPRLERLVRPSTASGDERRLLVLLHGLGSDERDMFSLGSEVDERYIVVALRAPIPYEVGGFAWFGLSWGEKGIRYDAVQASESLATLDDTLTGLRTEWQIPPEKVVVGGFSQGATMSTGLLLNRPDALGGALLMSGAMLPELLPEQAIPHPEARVLVQHGLYDQVLPVHLGRGVRYLLSSLGYRPTYKEYAMAHEVSYESLGDVRTWLLGPA